MEYLTDGGRDAAGAPEGGLYRVFDAVPPLFEALQRAAASGVAAAYGRL